MSASARRWFVPLLGVGLLVGLSFGAGEARRGFMRAVVGRDGAVPVDLSLAPSAGPGLPRSRRVRVVLLDGLGAAAAEGLPALSAVCAAGEELRIDVGFPTVSLPVQSVLWTGLTQQQSGLQYRSKQLESPPAGALPAQVAGSVAIAESHGEIVRSFGFTTALPPGETDEAWRAAFPDVAVTAVASPAPLVHVHMLRIDEAGHASGAASPEYAAAVASADELLARMRAAGPRDTSWLVLADHGHRSAGGHGSEHPEIRVVRGCLAGPGIAPTPGQAHVHMIDVARALADALGGSLPADARGRAWTDARAEPAPDATLPRPGPLRVALAVGIAGLGVLFGVLAGRFQGPAIALRLPWAAAAGLVGVALFVGWPSLSDQPVFAPQGQTLWYGCLPGAAVATALGLGSREPGRSAAVQLVPALGLLLAALVLCRGPEAWLANGGPPLMPRWTAATSVLFVLVRGLAEGAALAWLLALLWRALPRRRAAA